MIKFNKENITKYLQDKFNEIDLKRQAGNISKSVFNGYSNQLYLLDEILRFIYYETHED
jgi:hypothetical protein